MVVAYHEAVVTDVDMNVFCTVLRTVNKNRSSLEIIKLCDQVGKPNSHHIGNFLRQECGDVWLKVQVRNNLSCT